MKKINVRFADDKGNLRESSFETDSVEELRKSLVERGYFILSEQESKATFFERLSEILPLQRGVSITELTEFSQLLRTLLKAGLPIKDALDVLLDEMPEGPLKKALSQIREDIMEGISFSKCLSRHPNVFPDMYVRTVVAGEKSGALEKVLFRLIAYYREMSAIRRKLFSAMIYPAILLVVSFCAITYMIVAVVPEFADLFQSMDVPLPVYTQFVLGLASIVGEWFYLFLGLIFLGVFLFKRYHSSPVGRVAVDRIKLRIPLIKLLEEKYAYSQFSRTLSTLLDGGLPILESLDVVIDSLENKEIVSRLSRLSADIGSGDPFAKALRSVQGIPPTLVKVVHVGEESGNLGEMLSGIADHYDEEISSITSTLTSVIEPALFLFITSFVGALIIALLLPVLTAASNIK